MHVKPSDVPPAVQLRDLSVRFGEVVALDHVSLDVLRGEVVAFVGPNGAGKSSLLRAMTGLVPTTGDVLINGRALRVARASGVAYVAQRSLARWDLPLTVEDVVVCGRQGHRATLSRPSSRDRAAARDCLALLGVQGLTHRRIGELSGGQAQRVLLARALVQDPDIIVLDEPFAGVDPGAVHGLADVLMKLNDEGVTVLCALHEIDIAAKHFARIVALQRRVLADGPPSQVLNGDGIAALYSLPVDHAQSDA
ncbi:MAG: metal ABC transporter ATP-binding protein [Actinobacteria bacterium]|nr:metal ABC transporter ATP-binding protein [Actinomycetota bacterium]